MIYRLAAIAAVLALIVGMVLLTAPQPESVARAATGQPLHDPGYSAQQARLATAFPTGVCDWRKRGVSQVEPRRTWIDYGS